MVFFWSLSDSKSPQVSRTLNSILAIMNNVVVWMVSAHPLISKSSSPFNNPFVTIPKAPITIGIIVTFIFHGFSVVYSSFHFFSVLFCDQPGQQSPWFFKFTFFLLIIKRSGLLAEIRFIIIIIYSLRVFHISISRWSFTGDCVTASLLKSPGLLSVFWPFSTML